jgi:hypothetical protein
MLDGDDHRVIVFSCAPVSTTSVLIGLGLRLVSVIV